MQVRLGKSRNGVGGFLFIAPSRILGIMMGFGRKTVKTVRVAQVSSFLILTLARKAVRQVVNAECRMQNAESRVGLVSRFNTVEKSCKNTE